MPRKALAPALAALRFAGQARTMRGRDRTVDEDTAARVGVRLKVRGSAPSRAHAGPSLAPAAPLNAQLPSLETAVGGVLTGVLIGIGALPRPAHAVDGCLVLLCFAAPSWSAIPQCVPPIKEALRDLARGRPFLSCRCPVGAGNNASHRWSSAPTYCPPQYTRTRDLRRRRQLHLRLRRRGRSEDRGSLWTRTWWSMAGGSVPNTRPLRRRGSAPGTRGSRTTTRAGWPSSLLPRPPATSAPDRPWTPSASSPSSPPARRSSTPQPRKRWSASRARSTHMPSMPALCAGSSPGSRH